MAGMDTSDDFTPEVKHAAPAAAVFAQPAPDPKQLQPQFKPFELANPEMRANVLFIVTDCSSNMMADLPNPQPDGSKQPFDMTPFLPDWLTSVRKDPPALPRLIDVQRAIGAALLGDESIPGAAFTTTAVVARARDAVQLTLPNLERSCPKCNNAKRMVPMRLEVKSAWEPGRVLETWMCPDCDIHCAQWQRVDDVKSARFSDCIGPAIQRVWLDVTAGVHEALSRKQTPNDPLRGLAQCSVLNRFLGDYLAWQGVAGPGVFLHKARILFLCNNSGNLSAGCRLAALMDAASPDCLHHVPTCVILLGVDNRIASDAPMSETNKMLAAAAAKHEEKKNGGGRVFKRRQLDPGSWSSQLDVRAIGPSCVIRVAMCADIKPAIAKLKEWVAMVNQAPISRAEVSLDAAAHASYLFTDALGCAITLCPGQRIVLDHARLIAPELTLPLAPGGPVAHFVELEPNLQAELREPRKMHAMLRQIYLQQTGSATVFPDDLVAKKQQEDDDTRQIKRGKAAEPFAGVGPGPGVAGPAADALPLAPGGPVAMVEDDDL